MGFHTGIRRALGFGHGIIDRLSMYAGFHIRFDVRCMCKGYRLHAFLAKHKPARQITV